MCYRPVIQKVLILETHLTPLWVGGRDLYSILCFYRKTEAQRGEVVCLGSQSSSIESYGSSIGLFRAVLLKTPVSAWFWIMSPESLLFVTLVWWVGPRRRGVCVYEIKCVCVYGIKSSPFITHSPLQKHFIFILKHKSDNITHLPEIFQCCQRTQSKHLRMGSKILSELAPAWR